MRGKYLSKWLIFQTSQPAKTPIVKRLLAKKFPSHDFHYARFSQASKKILASQDWDGVISELKGLTSKDLKVFDTLVRHAKSKPMILVLSPSGFQWLNQKRKNCLEHCLIIMSEMKSLDYILQLPRLIEEVGKKRRLQFQNARLQRLVEKKLPHLNGFRNADAQDLSPPSDSLHTFFDSNACGLKIKIRSWDKIKERVNPTARLEILDLLTRTINASVRNSDRVLRSDEDEFLIFLSNTHDQLVSKCRERLERSLKSIQIAADRRLLPLKLSVLPLDSGASALRQ